MRIISVLNLKGGVGKTSTAVNLGAALARTGASVLLMDTDSAASATLHLGQLIDSQGMESVFIHGAKVADASTVETSTLGLHLIPASPGLADVDIMLAPRTGREFTLRKALAGALPYDWIIIDTPPGPGLVAVNALVASAWWLCPAVPAYLALAGVVDCLEFAREVHDGIGTCAQFSGVLLSQVDRRKRGHVEYVADARRERGFKCFKTMIPTCAPVEVAPAHGQTIFQRAPSSTAAQAFKQLALEVKRRTK